MNRGTSHPFKRRKKMKPPDIMNDGKKRVEKRKERKSEKKVRKRGWEKIGMGISGRRNKKKKWGKIIHPTGRKELGEGKFWERRKNGFVWRGNGNHPEKSGNGFPGKGRKRGGGLVGGGKASA